MSRRSVITIALAALAASSVGAEEPWIILGDEVITEPVELGDVIVAGNGSLTIRDVPEPGLRMSGSLWAANSARVTLDSSVIRFLSTFHGQYALAAVENAQVDIVGCDYAVPSGVQHALVAAGNASLVVSDTDFGEGSHQLITANNARLDAARLNGNFEVILENDSSMELADIPRDPGLGSIWVWVEFPAGSVAEYTPPMPGFVDSWSFPPPEASGIVQTVTVERCEARLWPMLVREGSVVTLRDIPEDNWVVVGLYLARSTAVSGLINGTLYEDRRLRIGAHDLHLVNASIDTWNLYPHERARVEVRNSVLGEILSMGSSRVRVVASTIDGSGGFFGARDASHITAAGSTITCTVESTQDATVELHHSVVQPYPIDPGGAWTRFGAYDNGVLYAHQTAVSTTPALGGRGAIAVSYLVDLPAEPPAAGVSLPLSGSVAMFCLDGGVTLDEWRLEARARGGGRPRLIASGSSNVEEDLLGTWVGEAGGVDHQLEIVLTDSLGRSLIGLLAVPAAGPHQRRGSERASP